MILEATVESDVFFNGWLPLKARALWFSNHFRIHGEKAGHVFQLIFLAPVMEKSCRSRNFSSYYSVIDFFFSEFISGFTAVS